MSAPPTFWFSLRSPYSWLAYRDLVEQHPDVADGLRWAPFWEPDPWSASMLADAGGEFPYATMSKAKHLYVLQDVARLAGRRGVRVCWPVDRDPVWEVPHLAFLIAERAGRGRAFVDAAYRARWEEGRDVCDPAVVADLARSLGLDAAAAAGAADDPELRDEGVRVLLEICRAGVFGVPYFVRGPHRFWGVDRLDDFVQAVRAAASDPASDPASGPLSGPTLRPRTGAVAVGRSSDGGHAGGCG